MKAGNGRRLLLGCVIALCVVLAGATLAYAYDETSGTVEVHRGECDRCHAAGPMSCGFCHFGFNPGGGKGPHGLYATTTKRCKSCHDAHVSGGADLLPGATVTASCNSCHDGTGGRGVYGTIAARGGTAGARHRIDTTTIVPGGDPSTGGSSTVTFKGANGNLGCDDCHSPHDADTVAAFAHERRRTTDDINAFTTNRLLRQHPAGAVASATVYGSDWCLACHAGRYAGVVHNHPVESVRDTATPFYYDRAAIMASDSATRTTTLGTLAATNRGYLMPVPRTAVQGAHKPICQQCHENSRNVGTLDGTGSLGDAAAFSINATDGQSVSDNPRYQNFPHETVNKRMTVETGDDLCLNCHPPTALP